MSAPTKTTGRERVLVGVIAAPGIPEELAAALSSSLAERLSKTFPHLDWKLELDSRAADSDVDLVRLAWRRMLEKRWRFALCLTDLPLRAGRRREAAQLSHLLGMGVVSVPAFGAFNLERRLEDACMRVLKAILCCPDAIARRVPAQRPTLRPGDAWVIPESPEAFDVVPRLPNGQMRLLAGMVRANRPWSLSIGLPRALVAALAVSALAVVSPAIWKITDGLATERLIAIAVGAVLIACVTLIARTGLWERSRSPELRDRMVLINLATATTVCVSVVAQYLVLFAIAALAGLALITTAVLQSEVRHVVAFADYLRLACLVSAFGTLSGSLGAATEPVEVVREAVYGFRAPEREKAPRRRAPIRIRRPRPQQA